MEKFVLSYTPTASCRRAIIIPALNEAYNITSVLAAARQHGDVFLVDDGSSDATSSIAQAAGATVVRHDQCRGYDSALSSGFVAVNEAGYEVAITIDADGQLPVADIPRFFAKLDEGYAVVVGNRPKMPRYSEWLFAVLMQASGSAVSDPFCGMKAYRLQLYSERRLFDTYRSIGTDLLIYAIRRGAPIANLPITVKDRVDQSRMGGRIRSELMLMKALLRGVYRLWFASKVT